MDPLLKQYRRTKKSEAREALLEQIKEELPVSEERLGLLIEELRNPTVYQTAFHVLTRVAPSRMWQLAVSDPSRTLLRSEAVKAVAQYATPDFTVAPEADALAMLRGVAANELPCVLSVVQKMGTEGARTLAAEIRAECIAEGRTYRASTAATAFAFGPWKEMAVPLVPCLAGRLDAADSGVEATLDTLAELGPLAIEAAPALRRFARIHRARWGERVLRALRAVQGDESLVDADAPPPTVDLPEIRRLVGSTPWATAWSALASHLSRPASSEEIAAIRAELSGLRRWGDEWKVWIADTDLGPFSDIVQRANVKASAMEGALPALEALPNLEWLDLYGDDDDDNALIAALGKLARSALAPRIRRLAVSASGSSMEALNALLGASWPALEKLDLSQFGLDDEGLAALERAPLKLQWLGLHGSLYVEKPDLERLVKAGVVLAGEIDTD